MLISIDKFQYTLSIVEYQEEECISCVKIRRKKMFKGNTFFTIIIITIMIVVSCIVKRMYIRGLCIFSLVEKKNEEEEDY